MGKTAIEVQSVWKKFRRGEIHDSLRDLIPALARRMTSRVTNPANLVDGEFWALKEINFQLGRGEIVGIIGPNGSGKSTLLKILSRILRPNQGTVRVNGRLGALIEVAAGFHPDLTGRENVFLNGTILGMKRVEIQRKFDEIVAFSEIEPFIDTPVKRYSSGMYVRLAFAVAAHVDPEVLLVDEVLAVGDARFQKKCLTKMQEIGRRGCTILFVSHNLSAVTRLCSRAILFDHGSLVQDGPSGEVVGRYMSPFQNTTATREWLDQSAAPGGEVARLCAVRLRKVDGQIAETVDVQRPLAIELEYRVLKSGHVLMPFHHLYNEEGVFLFSAHDLDANWACRPRPEGLWKSTAQIPGNLLAEGMHYVTSGLMTLDPVHNQFFERDVVSFRVTEKPGGCSARGGWVGPMGGALRPMLEWKTHFTPDECRAGKTPREA